MFNYELISENFAPPARLLVVSGPEEITLNSLSLV